MKYRTLILAIVIGIMGLSSCVGDLNVEPIDPNLTLPEEVLSSEEAYAQLLAKCYAGLTVSASEGPVNAQLAGSQRRLHCCTLGGHPNRQAGLICSRGKAAVDLCSCGSIAGNIRPGKQIISLYRYPGGHRLNILLRNRVCNVIGGIWAHRYLPADIINLCTGLCTAGNRHLESAAELGSHSLGILRSGSPPLPITAIDIQLPICCRKDTQTANSGGRHSK